MKPREYCCCALPILNFGIYACLTEQIVLAGLAGTLAIAAPSIVGAATPSSAPWIFAIVCYVAAVIQLLGFLGVAQEKAILFRRYTTLHIMITIAAFSIAAVWIAISASKHSSASTTCQKTFFASNSTSSTSSEGETLCNVFTWVDVGLMGILWVVLVIMQFYLYLVVSAYGSMQRKDHAQYKSLRSPTQTTNDAIPMTDRNDPWDSRPSTEYVADLGEYPEYGHSKQISNASVSTILGQQQQQQRDYGYTDADPAGYPPSRQGTTASARQRYNGGYPARPSNAYTEEPAPTPMQSNTFYTSNGGGMYLPEPSQAHPAEGSFGRKTPRLTRPY